MPKIDISFVMLKSYQSKQLGKKKNSACEAIQDSIIEDHAKMPLKLYPFQMGGSVKFDLD